MKSVVGVPSVVEQGIFVCEEVGALLDTEGQSLEGKVKGPLIWPVDRFVEVLLRSC